MIRRALTLWPRREHRPRVYAPRCGLCGKAWPTPTENAFIPGPDGPRRAVVCAVHLNGGQS